MEENHKGNIGKVSSWKKVETSIAMLAPTRAAIHISDVIVIQRIWIYILQGFDFAKSGIWQSCKIKFIFYDIVLIRFLCYLKFGFGYGLRPFLGQCHKICTFLF